MQILRDDFSVYTYTNGTYFRNVKRQFKKKVLKRNQVEANRSSN